MLFQSLIPMVFENMAMETYSAATAARKQDATKRIDYYNAEMGPYLEAELGRLFSDPSAMTICHLNITKKIIDQLAQVYRQPPTRTIEGTEKDQALFAEIAEGCSLDIKLRQASRYTKLLKTILIRPVWRNNKLDLDILTPDILDCVWGDTPEDLQKVLITDYGSSGRVEDVTYSYWSVGEEWKRLDYNGNTLEQAPNPYMTLPFLPIWDSPPTGSMFWAAGGSDLIALQEAINLKLTDLLHLLAFQSFGVGFIKGSPGGANLRVDPGTLVELPENGSIGFESQKAEIAQVVNAIDKLIKWSCVSQGLSAASFSTDLSDRQSGTAKQVDRTELEELRIEDVALWRGYERQLFSLMRTVFNYHNPARKISDAATLKIDFADPKLPADPVQEAQAWDLKLAMGVISAVDIAMELNPDLKDRDSAMAHLLKIREESKTLSQTI